MKEVGREEAIIGLLWEVEAGMAIKELCHRHGFSEFSYCLWRSKFGGMSCMNRTSIRWRLTIWFV